MRTYPFRLFLALSKFKPKLPPAPRVNLPTGKRCSRPLGTRQENEAAAQSDLRAVGIKTVALAAPSGR